VIDLERPGPPLSNSGPELDHRHAVGAGETMTGTFRTKFEAGPQSEWAELDREGEEIRLRVEQVIGALKPPKPDPAVEQMLEDFPLLRELTKYRPLSDILANDTLCADIFGGPPRIPPLRGQDVVKLHKLRRQRLPLPNGLKTTAQAAAKLGISIKTLNGYVKSGALKYVALGHGKKRQRKMFADADLTDLIASQTRKAEPCPSIAIRARRSGNTGSKSTIVSFSDLQKRQRGGKPKL
jgi:hypothetical protein